MDHYTFTWCITDTLSSDSTFPIPSWNISRLLRAFEATRFDTIPGNHEPCTNMDHDKGQNITGQLENVLHQFEDIARKIETIEALNAQRQCRPMWGLNEIIRQEWLHLSLRMECIWTLFRSWFSKSISAQFIKGRHDIHIHLKARGVCQ